MKYKPKSSLEKFGEKIYFLLVDNFPQTFYVGGMVRELLLGRRVADIDIATEAEPDAVIKLLDSHSIKLDDGNKKFGVITAASGPHRIEITTFRKDFYGSSRYPEVRFVKSAKVDSLRRDFSINALYLSQIDGFILDFHGGIPDLKNRHIRFIGAPAKRIKEDPLRIVRAIRFAVTLNLRIEHGTDLALEKHFDLVKSITRGRLYSELNKIKNPAQRKIVESILSYKKMLDNYA